MEPEDLLQEAMLKVFEVDPQNRRNCRSDLDALTFMASTMRSLASSRVEWRKRREEAAALETTHADYNLLTAMKADPNQKSPEQALLSSENEEAFQAFLLDECKGCEKTQLVLLGALTACGGKPCVTPLVSLKVRLQRSTSASIGCWIGIKTNGVYHDHQVETR